MARTRTHVIPGRGWKNDAALCSFLSVPPRHWGFHPRWRLCIEPFALSCRGVFMSVAYDPNKLGWPAAAVTVVGTLGLLFMAYTIHNKTYRHPRDPMNFQVYNAEDKAKHSTAGSHDAPAEGAAAPAAEAKH